MMYKKIFKPKPVADYLKPQRRFSRIKEEDIARIQAEVDRNCERIVALAEVDAEK